MSWASVAALPPARHPTDCTQLTETKKLRADTFGLGSIDQAEPFQLSMNACGWKLPPPPPPNDPSAPTAQHCTELTHEMLLRMPGVEESGTDAETSVQVEPSQCSMMSPDAIPVSSVVAPDAQQSEAVTQVRPYRYPPLGLDSVALGVTDHDAPSQCSISPWSPLAPGKIGRKFGFCCAGPALPTAQQSAALRHCTVDS